MEEIGEGDAFFRDVLALLLDADEAPIKAEAEPFVPNYTVKPAQERPKKKNAHRERLKAEMRALQRSAFALEGELLQLQRRKRPLVFPTGRESAEESWKRVAMQHREVLALTMYQNQALRVEFQRRCVLIDRLQMLLSVNAAHNAGLTRASTALARKDDRWLHSTLRAPVGYDDQALLSAFMAELDEVYRSTDQVLGESALDLDSQETQLLMIRPRRGLHGGEVLESTETISMPFAFSLVKTDAWRIVSSLYPNRLDGLDQLDDTLLGKIHVRGTDYEFDIHFTMRKYCEETSERMVIVWRTLTVGGGSFAGMDADETGWMLVRPKQSTAAEEATLMHSCVQFVPIFSVSADSAKARRFTEILMRCGDNDVMTIAKTMESLMLQENVVSIGTPS